MLYYISIFAFVELSLHIRTKPNLPGRIIFLIHVYIVCKNFIEYFWIRIHHGYQPIFMCLFVMIVPFHTLGNTDFVERVLECPFFFFYLSFLFSKQFMKDRIKIFFESLVDYSVNATGHERIFIIISISLFALGLFRLLVFCSINSISLLYLEFHLLVSSLMGYRYLKQPFIIFRICSWSFVMFPVDVWFYEFETFLFSFS